MSEKLPWLAVVASLGGLVIEHFIFGLTTLPRNGFLARRKSAGLTLIIPGLILISTATFAQTNPAARIYDEPDLTPWHSRYERGWLGNDKDVFRPLMSAQEQARLANLRYRPTLTIPAAEPFGFHATGNDVVASTASLKFLDDLSVATAWLQRNGYNTQTIADYMLMLRYWPKATNAPRPPKPLDALCIPPNALSDPRVDSLANRIFNGNVVFILLHEYGHVRFQHQGNRAVSPDASRANEEAADAFALNLLAKVNEAPLGLAMLFMAMANFYENRADFGSDGEYHAALTSRTHPLSEARLQAVARHIAAAGTGFTANSRAAALAVSLEITTVAKMLGDTDLQRLTARVGRTVTPADLAPRKSRQHLAPHCTAPASGLPFAGYFRGTILGGRTEFDLDAVLTQAGDRVTGSFSYGAGFARLEGRVTGTRLDYTWSLPPNRGRGTATLSTATPGGDTIAGTWGDNDANAGVGTLTVRRQP